MEVFRHFWEKALWFSVSTADSSLASIFSFLSRSYGLPLSSVLSNPYVRSELGVTLSKDSLEHIVDKDTSSTLLNTLLEDLDILPDLKFTGEGSISNVKEAIGIMLIIYADQVVDALEENMYTVIIKDSLDRWSSGSSYPRGYNTLASFTKSIKVRRKATQWESHMTLEEVIMLWQHTKVKGLYKVLEVVVSILTGLEVNMPSSTSDVDYPIRIKHRIRIASIKKKLLAIMSQSEAGSKLGQ